MAAKPALPISTLLWSAIGALLGGLLLNLMPCVFPVLAIKAVSVAQLGGESRSGHPCPGTGLYSGRYRHDADRRRRSRKPACRRRPARMGLSTPVSDLRHVHRLARLRDWAEPCWCLRVHLSLCQCRFIARGAQEPCGKLRHGARRRGRGDTLYRALHGRCDRLRSVGPDHFRRWYLPSSRNRHGASVPIARLFSWVGEDAAATWKMDGGSTAVAWPFRCSRP